MARYSIATSPSTKRVAQQSILPRYSLCKVWCATVLGALRDAFIATGSGPKGAAVFVKPSNA